MGKSCEQIKDQFVSCLKKEDCIKSGNPARYCLKNYLISDDCETSYGVCLLQKRSIEHAIKDTGQSILS